MRPMFPVTAGRTQASRVMGPVMLRAALSWVWAKFPFISTEVSGASHGRQAGEL